MLYLPTVTETPVTSVVEVGSFFQTCVPSGDSILFSKNTTGKLRNHNGQKELSEKMVFSRHSVLHVGVAVGLRI